MLAAPYPSSRRLYPFGPQIESNSRIAFVVIYDRTRHTGKLCADIPRLKIDQSFVRSIIRRLCHSTSAVRIFLRCTKRHIRGMMAS